MHEPTMIALEFDRIREELAAHAACGPGKELAQRIAPLLTPAQVREAQQETTEARTILAARRAIPFGGIHEIRPYVERACNGSALRPDQLTAVADTIYGCRKLHDFLRGHRETAPLLTRRAELFGRFDEVEQEIRRCIERGMVADRASRSLREVRVEIARLESRIQERLQSIMKQAGRHLQEALITVRGGRYVLPVKASARSAVPGTVHGASASGSTLFVEPEPVRRLAEELEAWRAMEEAEVEQVLTALSGLVAAHADGLLATLGAVAELDLIFARAKLSEAWDAHPVTWNEAGLVDLKEARHPLLGRGAVGNDIRMTPDCRMLVVTGPNTGGKTLLLKTLGLLAIIARCGLHIPVAEGSSLCFFDEVMADIGDNQSLEQSLSTFSGHIANVAPMLAQAGPHALILLDELGSGTDPHEGTGLGIALLEAFLARGAYVLATTHLREIKEWGRLTEGCAIAGMGFDGQTLQPTYRLRYGTLGQSHGLEIAARAGLPGDVVERARQLVYGGDGREGGVPPAPEASPKGVAGLAVAAPAPSAPVASPGVPAAGAVGAPAPRPSPGPSAPARPARADDRALVLAPLSPRRCRAWYEEGERMLTIADPVRRRHPEGLVVGDRLRVREGQAVEVAPRRNVLISRDPDTFAEMPVAANLDRLLILIAARQPDFHPSVLARHLLYAERQGVPALIGLTRAERVREQEAERLLAPFRELGYDAVVVSATRGQGTADLRALLGTGVTGVMGATGTDTADVLEALTAGEEQADVPAAAVGAPVSGPGQGDRPHRTGRTGNRPLPRELRTGGPPLLRTLRLPTGGWLLDLPGLRELGVWKPDLSTAFPEFGPYVGRCAQPGCLHRDEPRCAVREATQAGQIEPGRYQRYLGLLRHLRMA